MSKGVIINGEWKTGAKLDNIWKQQNLHHEFNLNHKHALYVAQGCPFAHSAILARSFLGISSDELPLVYVETIFDEEGWYFSEKKPDPYFGFGHLHQIYTKSDSHYTGRSTVPVLFDLDDQKIVSHESLEIIQILSQHYGSRSKRTLIRDTPDFQSLKQTIVDNINFGVYKAAFADSQQNYEKAYDAFFATLDHLNATYKFNSHDITAVDIRLFVSLIRFDSVYHDLFKLNKHHLSYYTNLWNFVCDFLQLSEVQGTVDLHQIKESYWLDFKFLNPSGFVPKGPELVFKRINL